MTSQYDQFHLGTSCGVFVTSQVRQSQLGNSWYVAMTSQIVGFYLGDSEMSWKRPKKVRLIDVSVATSWWRLNVVRDVEPEWDQNKT